MKEERLAKQRVREESSMSHEPSRVNNLSRNLEQGSRRKFRGFGYGSEPYVEVKLAPKKQEPRFKSKIQEMIWRAKQYKL